jgi:hypothetical protein
MQSGIAAETEAFSPRPYNVAKCFGCQYCLICGDGNKQHVCPCKDKPKKGKNRPDLKSCYYRNFIPDKTSKKLKAFLQACSRIYGYETDFNQQFRLALCSTCNNKYTERGRGSRTDIANSSGSTAATLQSDADDSSDQERSAQVKTVEIKLQLDNGDKQQSAVKWVKLPAHDYILFGLELEDAVVRLLPRGQQLADGYTVTYRIAQSRGMATHLADEQDFKKFLGEYQVQQQAKKEMLLTVSVASAENGSGKKERKKKRKNKVSF